MSRELVKTFAIGSAGVNTSAIFDYEGQTGRDSVPLPDSSTAPVMSLKKSKTRKGSTSRRKEQNRVAQKSFRGSRNAQFRELELDVEEISERIQIIAKRNSHLLELIHDLQEDNVEVGPGKNEELVSVQDWEYRSNPNAPCTTVKEQRGDESLLGYLSPLLLMPLSPLNRQSVTQHPQIRSEMRSSRWGVIDLPVLDAGEQPASLMWLSDESSQDSSEHTEGSASLVDRFRTESSFDQPLQSCSTCGEERQTARYLSQSSQRPTELCDLDTLMTGSKVAESKQEEIIGSAREWDMISGLPIQNIILQDPQDWSEHTGDKDNEAKAMRYSHGLGSCHTLPVLAHRLQQKQEELDTSLLDAAEKIRNLSNSPLALSGLGLSSNVAEPTVRRPSSGSQADSICYQYLRSGSDR